MSNNCDNIDYAHNRDKQDYEFQLAVHKFISTSLNFRMAENPEHIIIEYVKRNYKLLLYVPHPTPAIQLAAVETNLNAFEYIADPCNEARAYFKLMK